MALELKIPNDDIQVSKLKSGEIAIITKWSSKDFIGKIVIRSCNHLINVGKYDSYWEDMNHLTNEDLRVRVLKPGTELVIT